MKTAVVRIFDARGVPCGAGFLVSDRQIATCAHVVAQALRTAPTVVQAPTQPITLDFPLVAPGQQRKARVVGWHPVGAVVGASMLLKSSPPWAVQMAGSKNVRAVVWK